MNATQVLPSTEDNDTAGFWAAARSHKLVIQKCEHCGTVRFPPHPYCFRCRTAAYVWLPVSGYGRIWTFAVVHKPTLAAFMPFVPFPIVYVELEDHLPIRVAGNLVALPGAAINSVPSGSITIGQRVRVVFEKITDDVTLPRWMPVGNEEIT